MIDDQTCSDLAEQDADHRQAHADEGGRDGESCHVDGTEDATGVLSRALGLLEMVQHSKRHGGRLCFVNDRGDVADVVF